MSDTSDTESVTKSVLSDMEKIIEIYGGHRDIFAPAITFTSMVLYALDYSYRDEKKTEDDAEKLMNDAISFFSPLEVLDAMRENFKHAHYSDGDRREKMNAIFRDVFIRFAKIKGWNLYGEKQRDDLATRLDISADKLDKLTNRMESQETLYLFSKLRKEIVLPKTDRDLEKIVDYGKLLFHRINHHKASCEDAVKVWNGIVLPDSMSDEEWTDLTASGRYDKKIKTKDDILYKFMIDSMGVPGLIIPWILRAVCTSYWKESVLESQERVMNKWQEYITTRNVPLAAAMALTAAYHIPCDDWKKNDEYKNFKYPPGFQLLFKMLDQTLTLTETSKMEEETTIVLKALYASLFASGLISVKFAREVARKHLKSIEAIPDKDARRTLLGY